MHKNIEQAFIEVLSALGRDTEQHPPDPQKIISLMDYTYLDDNPTDEKLQHFQEQLLRYPVAGVCTYAPYFQQLNIPRSIKKSTVVNFPNGQGTLEDVQKEIITVLPFIDEIDYVLPSAWYIDQASREKALLDCQKIYKLCQSHDKTLKVILEIGNVQDPEVIYTISCEIIKQSGCDFLKTSTGKTTIGATPLAVYAILQAILDTNKTCGIKVSGGIRNIEQAWLYIQLASYCLKKQVDKQWFRIGASSLLDTIGLINF